MGQENWMDIHWGSHLVHKVDIKKGASNGRLDGDEGGNLEVSPLLELLCENKGCHKGIEMTRFLDFHWESRNFVQMQEVR